MFNQEQELMDLIQRVNALKRQVDSQKEAIGRVAASMAVGNITDFRILQSILEQLIVDDDEEPRKMK